MNAAFMNAGIIISASITRTITTIAAISVAAIAPPAQMRAALRLEELLPRGHLEAV